jgi:hypothetical protein
MRRVRVERQTDSHACIYRMTRPIPLSYERQKGGHAMLLRTRGLVRLATRRHHAFPLSRYALPFLPPAYINNTNTYNLNELEHRNHVELRSRHSAHWGCPYQS